jgi:hypothetical protein
MRRVNLGNGFRIATPDKNFIASIAENLSKG